MEQATPVWPLVLYCVAVIALVGGMTAASYVLGQRHMGKATVEPFEAGIVPVGDARFRFSVKFYLVAMFFVIFDLEAVFIFAWAIAFRDVGWAGYIEVLVFIAVLVAALIYLWRLGALDWGPRRSTFPALVGDDANAVAAEQAGGRDAKARIRARSFDEAVRAAPHSGAAAGSGGLGPEELDLAIQFRALLLLRGDGHQPSPANTTSPASARK